MDVDHRDSKLLELVENVFLRVIVKNPSDYGFRKFIFLVALSMELI